MRYVAAPWVFSAVLMTAGCGGAAIESPRESDDGGVDGDTRTGALDAGPSQPSVDSNLPPIDAGTVRWQDLYAAYFGPSGTASCTAQNLCHGAPDQQGAQVSGYVCGETSDTCWKGISTLIVPYMGSGPTGTYLYAVVRKPNGQGNMPNGSTYTFQPYDLARIAAWIQEGAFNN